MNEHWDSEDSFLEETQSSAPFTMKLGRQAWRFQIEDATRDFPIIRATLVEPDFRPFRCGSDGRPSATRVGPARFSLRWHAAERRLVRGMIPRSVSSADRAALRDRLAKAIAQARAGGWEW